MSLSVALSHFLSSSLRHFTHLGGCIMKSFLLRSFPFNTEHWSKHCGPATLEQATYYDTLFYHQPDDSKSVAVG